MVSHDFRFFGLVAGVSIRQRGALLEHAASDIAVHGRIPFAIVIGVLAFLRMGPARQRPRDPALRRRGCCGVLCAAGPRHRS